MNKKLLLVILAITLVVVAGVSLFYYRNNGKFTIAWKSPLIEREDWQPIADKTNDKEIKPSTKFTSHYEPVNYSGTEVEYPGSPTNVTLPTIPSNQSLMPPPYHPFDRFPEPGAKDVPLYTHISVSFPRPPGILKLEIEPEVEISHVKKKLIFYSGKYTFYPAKPLQPGTNYTVTITAGQKEPPGHGFAPTLTTSWNFSTIQRGM